MYPCGLNSARLRYREFSRNDAHTVIRLSRLDDSGIFAAPGDVLDYSTFERWFDWIDRGARAVPRREFRLAVESDRGLVGLARICNDMPWSGVGSIGYAFVATEHGQGYGTEAARTMVEFGFERLGLHRIEAAIRPDNVPSIKVVEKLGMTLEGRLRDYFLERRERHDALIYSILAPEWRAREQQTP